MSLPCAIGHAALRIIDRARPDSLERAARPFIPMRFHAERLATAYLAGPWEAAALYDRAARVVGKRSRWLERLSHKIHADGRGQGGLQRRTVVDWILGDRGFARHCQDVDIEVSTAIWNERPPIQPAAGAPSNWRLPPIATAGELAAWLGITADELDWFAGRRNWSRRRSPNERSRHYQYRAIKKRHGEVRLLEVPKPRLRNLQRQILHRLLDEIPPHDAAHGFRAGRSVRSFAEPHTGKRLVIRLDLRDFFPMVSASRILHIFLTAGYPETVARLLAGVCTHAASAYVIGALELTLTERSRLEAFYCRPHLPQGAPTSPALANLAAYRLDCRLAALAAAMDANYTRYADDLAFSGGRELERAARRFHAQVAGIALEEGFVVHTRKTRIMRAGSRQRLAGVVVNRHPNLARSDYDRLRAILHNCVVHGPEAENRDGHRDFRSHLAGSIGFVEMLNANRGRRLRALFDRIAW